MKHYLLLPILIFFSGGLFSQQSSGTKRYYRNKKYHYRRHQRWRYFAQQFLFQWTPRHQAIGNVEYIFTLKEIFDRGTAVENAFAYSPVIFTKTVPTTSLAYTVFDPPLLENTTYAWNVRAVVREGFEEVNAFENNGFSEIRSFTILPGCHAPTQLSAVQEGMYERISWLPADAAAVQVVAYRGKKNKGEWALIKGNMDYANIFDVSPGIEIEYKVGTACADGTVTYSEIRNFTLEDTRKDIAAKCGVEPKITLDLTTRLENLFPNDVFYTGDFPVTVAEASGGSGRFSGTGWTAYPVFGNVKVAVKFDNILINADRQLIDGFVATTYDKTESGIKNLDREYRPDQGNGEPALTWDMQLDAAIPPGGSITYDPATGTLVITDANGNPIGNITLPTDVIEQFNGNEPYTYVVKDANGDTYAITKDENGNISTEKVRVTATESEDKSIFISDRDFLYALNSFNTDSLFTFNTLNIPIGQIDDLELNVNYLDQALRNRIASTGGIFNLTNPTFDAVHWNDSIRTDLYSWELKNTSTNTIIKQVED